MFQTDQESNKNDEDELVEEEMEPPVQLREQTRTGKVCENSVTIIVM